MSPGVCYFTVTGALPLEVREEPAEVSTLGATHKLLHRV